MVKVCIIGAGRAGVEAAAEAARRGAQVTLLERSDCLLPHRSAWPSFVASPSSMSSPGPPDSLASVDVAYSRPAIAVRPASVVTPDGEVRFDKVVVATGSRQVFRTFPGFTKEGVIALDSLARFVELGRQRSSLRKIVVCGESPTGLRVADALSGDGTQVTLLCPGGKMLNDLHPDLDVKVRLSARRKGVRMVDEPIFRAFGHRAVEAVLAGGVVIPCDAIAVAPHEEPLIPQGCQPKGPHRGLSVGRELRSPVWGCYAAGGCAELIDGALGGVSLKNSAKSSGRTAGANAAGSSLVFSPIGVFTGTFFGLRVSWAGLGFSEARSIGLHARQISATGDEESGSSLVYDGDTGRVLGIQTVEKSSEDRSSLLPLLISQRVSIRALAFKDLGGSTDISLLSEAARQGLSEEARASA
ncbi:MAG: NAD(P)/FAD-dependent oxidoreductase [Thaumarchaeota archaeon]|nr:NAD(P)/FAD-dependent oxidoreductase [Nitrososphaerota archaeon]